MKIKVISILIIFLIISVGCDDNEFPELNKFADHPINIKDVNSSHDELNETVTGFYNNYLTFLFSSNKDSEGDNYDLYNYLLKVTGNVNGDTIYFDLNENGYSYYDSLINNVNSEFNENNITVFRNNQYGYDIFFYTSDYLNNTEIYYSVGDIYRETWEEPSNLTRLNSSSNEKNILILNNSILFCSDINGDYDIFEIDVDSNTSLINWLETDETPIINEYELLNSSFDDKSPYINGNYLYFSSNRDGGYGGYDLYYSYYSNGVWSEPQNCGSTINSEFDEVNPVTIYYSNYKNDLLFFSSNKPGGKGGYDIYASGIPKLVN